jgi:hypothetical protein
MTEVNNINIKLEVFKDKSSGKLSIMAHFDSNAPNVFEENDGVFWMPTIEENDLLNEAFQFIPLEGGSAPTVEPSPEPEKIEEEQPPEPVIQEEVEPTPEIKEEPKPADLPPLEEPKKPDLFEVTEENIKKDDLEKDIERQTDEQPPEEPKSDEQETEKKEGDEGIIVEADSDAIEEALKKHTDKDEAMVEADEQTIIDKVLSQKKKGKWSKK